ncbi:inositol monophosphatase [bacterium]|nr:inositol monophosphatase [bacterium]MBU1991024.1 inositol monophosphatase [bacterium]
MLLSEQLYEIALECRDLFLEGFYSNQDVKYKGTVDLVTEYDVAIEKHLSLKLKEKFPEYVLVGEENTKEMHYPSRAIYIDPIDGTTNFVHGIEHCAISIGMWKEGVPVAALVYNPVLEECFRADAGKGAYLNGKALHVSTQTSLQQSLVATGFPYTKVQRGKDYEWVLKNISNLLPITRDIRRLGSASLDMCYLAQGKFDVYYECNLKPWDVAAGILIVQEAGGKITNGYAKPYMFSDNVLVATNTLVHNELLENFVQY